MHIRPFDGSDRDHAAVVEIWNAHLPWMPTTLEELRHREANRPPELLWGRVLAEDAGRIVAQAYYGDLLEVELDRDCLVFVQVHPDLWGRGIGTAVYDDVVEILREQDLLWLTSYACEEEPGSVRFLTKRGYRNVFREQDSLLDVTSFDSVPFAGVDWRVSALGVEILTGSQLDAARPDWRRELWELDWEIRQDEPHIDTPKNVPYDIYCKWFESPGFLPDALFVAVLDGAFVGRSELWRRLGARGRLYTALTGVVRGQRRKGIATALKLRGIDYAREHGFAGVQTENAEQNPMYLLNVKLGFEPIPAWLWFKKDLKERPAEGARKEGAA